MTVLSPVALVPIRSFTGMTRLSAVLDDDQRSQLSITLADGVVTAVTDAGMEAIIITSSPDVATWAEENQMAVCKDPGNGLSAAVEAGVSMVGSGPWLAIHADLPLVTPTAIATVARVCRSATVIVPSYDGGTTVIGGRGTFPFSYGTGSFQRHLASAPNAAVVVSPALSVDVDTEYGLEMVPRLLREKTDVFKS